MYYINNPLINNTIVNFSENKTILNIRNFHEKKHNTSHKLIPAESTTSPHNSGLNNEYQLLSRHFHFHPICEIADDKNAAEEEKQLDARSRR